MLITLPASDDATVESPVERIQSERATAVQIGLGYGAWWALAVPVAPSVALVNTEHLVTRARA